MNTGKVSTFTLERFRLGELSQEDTQAVNEALAANGELRSRLEKIDESDRELRLRYPPEFFGAEFFGLKNHGFTVRRTPLRLNRPARAGLIAAAAAVGIILPVLFLLLRGGTGTSGLAENEINPDNGVSIAGLDRPKGNIMTGSELSIYLKDAREIIEDQAVLAAGNTVQLAYTAPTGSQRYGVIFSIDGRSVVTMHYPYRLGQSSLLISGRRTFLSEAYTLDDAPYFEVFVMVVSEEPLDAGTVIGKARELAGNLDVPDQPDAAAVSIEEKSRAVFESCQVETITVYKKGVS
jgi:hypothetical protein